MARAEHPEEELAFRLVDPAEFPDLLEKLWPAGGLIDLDGVTLARVGEKIKGSVHLFSSKTHGSTKERLRLSLDNRGLKARLERKRFVNGIKYEERLKRTRQKKKIARMLKQLQPVIAVFCKERATLVYKFMSARGKVSVARYVTIGIDRIAAIPVDASDKGKIFGFYDVDIEGDGSGSELVFARSRFFHTQLRELLKPLTQATSKWRVALNASNGVRARSQEYKSYDDALNFFGNCVNKFKQIFPDGHLLVGPNAPPGTRK